MTSVSSYSNEEILESIFTTRIEYIRSVSQFETVKKLYTETNNTMHYTIATDVSPEDWEIIMLKIGDLGICLNQLRSHFPRLVFRPVASLKDVLALPVNPPYTIVLLIEAEEELYDLICIAAAFRSYLVGSGKYKAEIFDTQSPPPTHLTQPTLSITLPHPSVWSILTTEAVKWIGRGVFALGCFHAIRGLRGIRIPTINLVNFSLFSGGNGKRSGSQSSS